MRCRTVKELRDSKSTDFRLSFGCPVLDQLTGGGVHGGITEISGEAGTGKTQLCLSLAVRCALPLESCGFGSRTAYLCCGEGEFPVKRLSQLADRFGFSSMSSGGGSSSLMDQVLIQQCRTIEDAVESMHQTIPQLCREKNVRLIVIDSIAGLVRTELDTRSSEDMRTRSSLLVSLSSQLKRLSDTFRLCVVVVNQVTATGFGDGGLASSLPASSPVARARATPCLGLLWTHCINTRIFLMRDSYALRSSEGSGGGRDQASPYSGSTCGESDFSAGIVGAGAHRGEGCANGSLVPLNSRRLFTVVFSPCCASASCSFDISADGLRGHPSR